MGSRCEHDERRTRRGGGAAHRQGLSCIRRGEGRCGAEVLETIANRLYYAAYNAVSALLISNGDTAQTHSGVRHIFGLKFIKTGILPPETGRLYHRLFSLRQTGDYDDTYDVAAEDVLPNIEPTGKLLDVVVAKARELIIK